jgi:hypothetical protein
VRVASDHDSSLFAGYGNRFHSRSGLVNDEISELPYDLNTLIFNFSSPLYGKQAIAEYSYMLVDFDRDGHLVKQNRKRIYLSASGNLYILK